jgi:16S rRNA A1518/A1519 N6-dimethyltransferase RsmA/KsgA/DIM1 with predicted DNA glycosylase/AP lyase activity
MRRDDHLRAEVRGFETFVHKVFSFRRKMLRKALEQAGYDPAVVLQGREADGQLRPEVFSPEQMYQMFKVAIAEATSSDIA